MPAGGSEHLAIGGWIKIIFNDISYNLFKDLVPLSIPQRYLLSTLISNFCLSKANFISFRS